MTILVNIPFTGVGIAVLIFVCILFFSIIKSHRIKCVCRRKSKTKARLHDPRLCCLIVNLLSAFFPL